MTSGGARDENIGLTKKCFYYLLVCLYQISFAEFENEHEFDEFDDKEHFFMTISF